MARSAHSRHPRPSGRLRHVGWLALLPLSGCAKQGISPSAQDVHQLYTVIMILALPVFIGVEAALIWCVIRYRKRDTETPPPVQSVGGNRSLAVFFAIPAV